MGKKLYVGNLPYSATDDVLQNLFGEVGTVESAKVIVDGMTGKSKGFGFVEMSTDDEAKEAISKLDGSDCDGRTIKVNEARPKASGGGRDRGGFRKNRW